MDAITNEILKTGASLRPIFFAIISANFFLSVIVLCVFISILIILIRTVRVRCREVAKKVKNTQKLVREHLSPSVDEFLTLVAEIGLTEDRVKEIYTAYDSRRRKVAEKQLKYPNEMIKEFEIIKAFMSESNFIKGAGFRMHRLLHEGRIKEFLDDDEGLTILAPSFQPIKAPIKKIEATDDVPPKAKTTVRNQQTKGKAFIEGKASAAAKLNLSPKRTSLKK